MVIPCHCTDLVKEIRAAAFSEAWLGSCKLHLETSLHMFEANGQGFLENSWAMAEGRVGEKHRRCSCEGGGGVARIRQAAGR